MKIIRTLFQDNPELEGTHHFRPNSHKVIVVLDLEHQDEVYTNQIPDLASKMERALPGIFPREGDLMTHLCGGQDTEHEIHSFRDEVEQGTTLAHLMEHILLFMLSKRSLHCAGYTGRRSIDIERGIHTHYYMVVEYPTKLEAIVAIELAFELIKSWVDGKSVQMNPQHLISSIQDQIEVMLA